MSAQHTPGPWKVCAETARQFTVFRWLDGRQGESRRIERICNTNGNTKRFRSEAAAYAAVAKATGAAS